MAGLFRDLLTFFGISLSAPTNLEEFFPWLFSVVVALGIFLYVFELVKSCVRAFTRGRFL